MLDDSSLHDDSYHSPVLRTELIELQKERKRLSDQRREYNKVVAASGRTDHLYDRLEVAAYSLPETIGQIFDIGAPISINSEGKEAVLVFSDWHYGLSTSNIWNTFHVSVCVNRVQNLVMDATKRIVDHGCERLHIVILGDMVHGAIHTSARVESEELVTDQLIQVSEILAQAIGFLSGRVSETLVYATYGNHARVVAKKKDNIHRDNFERLIPWWLKWRLKENPSVTIFDQEDTEFINLKVCGYNICASHGDLDNVHTSPRTLQTLFTRKFGPAAHVDYIILGDKHHREEFEEFGICSMVSGSLCGTDGYANEKRLYSNPEQLLLIFDKEVGLDATYHIRCRDTATINNFKEEQPR